MFIFPPKPLTVGAITDEGALALDFDESCCDIIELRLDAVGSGSAVMDFCERHHGKVPLLMTARDPAEGGMRDQPFAERLAMQRAMLSYASAIDAEFANLSLYGDFLSEAKEQGVALILSSHDFLSFDHIATIETLANSHAAGAQVAKAAVTLRDAVDLTLFESLALDLAGSQFSLMGMGFYGPASRILAAQHGSLLNYGYLGAEPTAPGQWPARLLKEAIAACPRIPSSESY